MPSPSLRHAPVSCLLAPLLLAAIAVSSAAARAGGHEEGPSLFTVDSMFVSNAIGYSLVGNFGQAPIPVRFAPASAQPGLDRNLQNRGFAPQMIGITRRGRLSGQENALTIEGFLSLIDSVDRTATFGFSADYVIGANGQITVSRTTVVSSLSEVPTVRFAVVPASSVSIFRIAPRTSVFDALQYLRDISPPRNLDEDSRLAVNEGEYYIFVAFLDRVAADSRVGLYLSGALAPTLPRALTVLGQQGWFLAYTKVRIAGRAPDTLSAQAVFMAPGQAESAVLETLTVGIR
jgi:hypothetical protein